MNFEKQTIVIPTLSGKFSVDAAVMNGWAVHPKLISVDGDGEDNVFPIFAKRGAWKVTHISSGHCIPIKITRHRTAEKICRAFATKFGPLPDLEVASLYGSPLAKEMKDLLNEVLAS